VLYNKRECKYFKNAKIQETVIFKTPTTSVPSFCSKSRMQSNTNYCLISPDSKSSYSIKQD
jgi:hypothetical protein